MLQAAPLRSFVLAVALLALPGRALADGLKVLDKPLRIFPGQPFRVALQQPKGAGKLTVRVPATLKLFDTWPKDDIQRFYFRALAPGEATLHFAGKGGTLRLPLRVAAWGELFRPAKHGRIALPRIWPMGESDYRHLKKRHTFYTPEQIAAMRASNAKPHPLAKRWLAMSDAEVWKIIPGPSVPRTCLIALGGGGREDARQKGCPVCGMKVYEGRSAFYPWIFDPDKHPWKVGCPACGTWFPSNDWQEGDMHSGPFPDDGFGCEPVRPVLSPSGVPWRWPFIAYYHQWQAYMRTFTPGIERCAEAFARTGDRRYAHKAAIGLFRFAESLLDMSANLAHRKMAVRDAILRWPVGAPRPRKSLRGTFLYIQPNWDTPRMEAMARAWDLIFDQVDGDAALLAFCRSRYHPEIRTAEDFRRFVEAGVLRTGLQACIDDAVSRNYPMQEAAVATLALVLDSPRSVELADWLLNDGRRMRFALTNEFYKDGAGHESESYNRIQIRDMERIFDLLERIRAFYRQAWSRRGLPVVCRDPKYRRMYDFVLDNSLIGRTTTWTGDTGTSTSSAPRKPMQGFPLRPRDFLNVYRRTRDPRFAQALCGPRARPPAALRDAALRAAAEKIVRQRGWQVKLRSNILDGFGHAILRSGEGDRRRAFWLRYGRVVQHTHNDMLTMGLAALERDMLPELGYPQGWTYAGAWEANWATHYGTHITGVRTRQFGIGRLTLFADTPPARVASATADAGERARRSRTIVLVDLSADDAYAVTLECVLGGTEHTLSFHGPQGAAEAIGVKLAEQKGGTVAGTDVAYGDTAAAGRGDSELACRAFLYDVRRARPTGIWALDYALQGQKGVHLRATAIAPDGCELALAEGKPPQGKKSYQMTWAIVRRRGRAPLASRFVTVIEPYEGERIVRKIERLPLAGEAGGPFAPVGLRITSDEYVDTLILQPSPAAACTTGDGTVCDGEFGFWRRRRGESGGLVSAVLVAGTKLHRGPAGIGLAESAYRGRIKACDWPRRTIVVEPAPEDPGALVGRHVRIHNPRGSSASYLVEAARTDGDACRITLPLDPRIGEGFVAGCDDDAVRCDARLRFAGFCRYYAGKTLANEDASCVYRLADVDRAGRCRIDPAADAKPPAARLSAEFADKDGDGRARFVIYDYGPGDEVTVNAAAVVRPGATTRRAR